MIIIQVYNSVNLQYLKSQFAADVSRFPRVLTSDSSCICACVGVRLAGGQ